VEMLRPRARGRVRGVEPEGDDPIGNGRVGGEALVPHVRDRAEPDCETELAKRETALGGAFELTRSQVGLEAGERRREEQIAQAAGLERAATLELVHAIRVDEE